MRSALTLFALLATAIAGRADLHAYVKKADDSFRWEVKEKRPAPMGTAFILELTSQTWQGIAWEHQMLVYVPDGVKVGDTVFLWNEGGKADPSKTLLAFDLARRAKVPVAFLYGIPKQPLFEGKKEDALISETFVRYLKTEDEDWPLLFPMVKSLVRAMDVVQEFAKKEWKADVKSFVVSGASKRGWTTWLTAVADPRVKAIAPLVIDTLNMKAQMPHQIASFGKPSDQIKDYTERGLVPIPKGGQAEKLWSMVDPWAYREKLTMPKMIINGTNDPYWAQDALNLYWDDLTGDKWVLYVPNAGHNLEQKYEGGRKDRNRILSTLSAYMRSQIAGKPMPKLKWEHGADGDKLSLTVTSDREPKAARLWVADAPTRDFREAKWTESPAKLEKGTVTGVAETPKAGFRTLFAECEFEEDGLTYYLSTQLKMFQAR